MNTPKHQVRAVLAACGFGNSTGLPITLLTVVHTNFPVTSDLGRVDPTLFLSVYLLLYPVLQWGLGGYLLAPQNEGEDSHVPDGTAVGHYRYNVLNHQTPPAKYKGLTSTDEGLYMTEVDLSTLASKPSKLDALLENSEPIVEEDKFLLADDIEPPTYESTAEISKTDDEYGYYSEANSGDNSNSTDKAPECGDKQKEGLLKDPDENENEDDTLYETIANVLDRCLQPPVVGAILGIICAVLPKLRGILVDLIDRDSTAPLQFLFDGLYAVGQAAVPLNM